MNALDTYIDNVDALIRRLSPAEQKRLLTDIGRKIRISNKRRIKANIEPDGLSMTPRHSSKSYLNGYRKLQENEDLPIGKEFIYDGPEMRKHNVGSIRQMVSLKTPETDARYGNMWRLHKGGRWYQRTNFNPNYVEGFALSDSALEGGVSKFSRSFIYVRGKPRLRDKLMFRRIHQYKYLKMKASTHEAAIGFLGGLVGYIAAAHQYGEDGRPERSLIGFSDEDLHLIEQMLIQHLSAV